MRFLNISTVAWVIGLIIVSLIVHSIYSAGNAVYQGQLQLRAENQMRNLIQGFHNYMGDHNLGASGNNLAVIAIENGYCSVDMIDKTTSDYCIGPWGKNNWIFMSSNTNVHPYEGSMNIYILGLDRDACSYLGSIFATGNPDLLHVIVDKTDVVLIGSDKKPHLTPADVDKACNRSGMNNSLYITFNP